MPPPDPWLDKLKELLCRLYREWGGDCSTLPPDIRGTIAILQSCFIKDGNPRPADTAGAAEFDALLAEIEAHLDLQQNSLDTVDDTALRILIAQLKV